VSTSITRPHPNPSPEGRGAYPPFPPREGGWGVRSVAVASLLLGLAGVVVAAPADRDVAPAPRPAPPKVLPAVPDAQELVIYTHLRPIRVHLATQLEGKSIAEMWADKLRGAFDYFDRDDDGFLDAKEVGNVFSDSGVQQMLQNGFYQPTPQDRPSVERLDKDADGQVSFAEYLAYYRGSTSMVFRAQPVVAENPAGAAVTEALFKMMDGNSDGKLTKDEVKAIEHLLATRDADEDECLAQAELVPNIYDPRQFRGQVVQFQPDGRMIQPATANQTVVTYQPGRIPGTLTQQVIKRYDKDGDFDLTREEVGFDEDTFARLDRDGNAKLDGEELDAWRTGPADLEISLSLAPKAVDCLAKLKTDAKTVAARGFVVKQVESGRLIIRCGRQPIEFWAYAAVVANFRQPALKTQYQYLFTQAAGMKDHVLEKDLNGPNAVQFQFLRTLFDAADANGNAKLTKAEFDGYFDLQDSFRNVAIAVTPAVQTPTLFQLLDENRDGRLGVRELRTSWDRLVVLEPGSGEVITRNAIVPTVSLRLSRSLDRFALNQAQVIYEQPNQQVRVPQKGPVWFRKMDRNADGDVSRSEFLGTKAEFDTMDADKDNLISLVEAEAYDTAMRGKEGNEPKK
jgi:Ca2+-binding EF-hand superfamily protein